MEHLTGVDQAACNAARLIRMRPQLGKSGFMTVERPDPSTSEPLAALSIDINAGIPANQRRDRFDQPRSCLEPATLRCLLPRRVRYFLSFDAMKIHERRHDIGDIGQFLDGGISVTDDIGCFGCLPSELCSHSCYEILAGQVPHFNGSSLAGSRLQTAHANTRFHTASDATAGNVMNTRL